MRWSLNVTLTVATTSVRPSPVTSPTAMASVVPPTAVARYGANRGDEPAAVPATTGTATAATTATAARRSGQTERRWRGSMLGVPPR